MDRSYHRAAYEHHCAKAAVYRSKAESHLARASAHRSHLGFGGRTDYSLDPSYGEMVDKYPGGFKVSLVERRANDPNDRQFARGVSDARAVIDEAAYNELLGTRRAYLSAFTHGYKQRALNGVDWEDAYTWFNVQPDNRMIYNPRR